VDALARANVSGAGFPAQRPLALVVFDIDHMRSGTRCHPQNARFAARECVRKIP